MPVTFAGPPRLVDYHVPLLLYVCAVRCCYYVTVYVRLIYLLYVTVIYLRLVGLVYFTFVDYHHIFTALRLILCPLPVCVTVHALPRVPVTARVVYSPAVRLPPTFAWLYCCVCGCCRLRLYLLVTFVTLHTYITLMVDSLQLVDLLYFCCCYILYVAFIRSPVPFVVLLPIPHVYRSVVTDRCALITTLRSRVLVCCHIFSPLPVYFIITVLLLGCDLLFFTFHNVDYCTRCWFTYSRLWCYLTYVPVPHVCGLFDYLLLRLLYYGLLIPSPSWRAFALPRFFTTHTFAFAFAFPLRLRSPFIAVRLFCSRLFFTALLVVAYLGSVTLVLRCPLFYLAFDSGSLQICWLPFIALFPAAGLLRIPLPTYVRCRTVTVPRSQLRYVCPALPLPSSVYCVYYAFLPRARYATCTPYFILPPTSSPL